MVAWGPQQVLTRQRQKAEGRRHIYIDVSRMEVFVVFFVAAFFLAVFLLREFWKAKGCKEQGFDCGSVASIFCFDIYIYIYIYVYNAIHCIYCGADMRS